MRLKLLAIVIATIIIIVDAINRQERTNLHLLIIDDIAYLGEIVEQYY